MSDFTALTRASQSWPMPKTGKSDIRLKEGQVMSNASAKVNLDVEHLTAQIAKSRDIKVELNKGGQFSKNLATALNSRIEAFDAVIKTFSAGYAQPTEKLATDIDALFAAAGHLADAARILAPKVVTDNTGSNGTKAVEPDAKA